MIERTSGCSSVIDRARRAAVDGCCSEGYTSSRAAHTLPELGLHGATYVVGGAGTGRTAVNDYERT